MNKYKVLSVGLLALLSTSIFACGPSKGGKGGGSSSNSSDEGSGSITSHTAGEIEEYMNGLKATSQGNHLYYHYLRFHKENQSQEQWEKSYNDWDVWAWQYYPNKGEGTRFNWAGRTTNYNSKTFEASGDAIVDEIGGAYIDIDLGATYTGFWNNEDHSIGGATTSFEGAEMVGLQIVKSASRTATPVEGQDNFWENDGGDLLINLADFALANKDGTTSYHCFVLQNKVQVSFSNMPIGAEEAVDPYAGDDGTAVTKGVSKYEDVDWSTTAEIQKTSSEFLSGGDILTKGAGVGYQIMVSSFADSDGDGFGDIYGIKQKLDYLQDLGVNVLWLTPIQLSDSYHGYDIKDYNQVDPKFGSTASPNYDGNRVTSDSAMRDYKDLIADAHSRHMAVVMDLVLNHTSTSNTWFIQSSLKDDEYRGYYQWGNHDTDSDVTKEKYWYPYGDTVYSYYAKFGTSMPELNYSCTSTRAAMAAVALNWMEIGVDGFRMDAIKHIYMADEVNASSGDTIVSDVSESGDYSSNLTKNLHFWRQLAKDVKSVYPKAFFVGENFDGHAYQAAPYYEGFDSLFDFYSYFNLTSAAAHAHHSEVPGHAASFLGAWEGSACTDVSGSAFKYLSDSKWTLKDVMNVNNKYRTGGSGPNNSSGYSFINGAFTSNHDIARCINRVAGTEYNSNGLTAQGTITGSNYNDMLKLATDVEIAELMLPGCTWIYYGDEIGMTGNWIGGAKKSTDPYADLSYRQPMKWTDSGVVGDGSYTTGYSVTNSNMEVEWDDVNASSAVKSVESAKDDAHFKAIRDFARLKSTSPVLMRGNMTVNAPVGVSDNNIYDVTRTLGENKIRIIVNFTDSTYATGASGTSLASYNGASVSSVPAKGAIAILLSGTADGGGSGGGDVTPTEYYGPEGSTKVSWYLAGEGSLWQGVDGWQIANAVQLWSNPSNTSDKGCILNVTIQEGDKFKVTDGTTWYGYEKVDSYTGENNLGLKNFVGADDGYGGKNFLCTETAVYDIYVNSGGTFWIQAHA